MTLTCPTCGEPFEPIRPTVGRKNPKAAFCSEECWQKDWNATHLTPGRMKPRMRSENGLHWLSDAGTPEEAAQRAARWAEKARGK